MKRQHQRGVECMQQQEMAAKGGESIHRSEEEVAPVYIAISQALP